MEISMENQAAVPIGAAKSSGSAGDVRDENNKFQSAITAWRNIDLSHLVSELDGTTTEIVNHQKDSLVSRKELAQKTKDFRKLEDEVKLVEIKSLLKAYQSFIDMLTSHGKATSSAFLRVYSSISEAPDPYPLLEASVDSILACDETLPRLVAENEKLQETLRQVTEDLDTSTAMTKSERKARQEVEVNWETNIKAIENSWREVLEEKQDNWDSKEQSLTEKLEGQERLLTEYKASLEVSQRLGQEAGPNNRLAQNTASLAELEIISSDLDRTTQRLAEVESRNESLRTQLAQATSTSQTNPRAEDDDEASRLRLENSSLLHKLETVRLEKDAEARKESARVRTLEKEAKAATNDKEAARKKLETMKDYQEIKQELQILKSIELTSLDDTEAQEIGSAHAKDPQRETLESLLLARNKKLNDELAVLRVSQQEAKQEVEQLQQSSTKTKEDLAQAQQLNATLESDLVKVQQEVGDVLPSSALSVAGTYTSRYPQSSYNQSPNAQRRGRASSPTSSIISGWDSSSIANRNPIDAFRAGEAVGGGSGILPMVQAQRDRFKQKTGQLEQELSKQHTTISTLRQEVASLQKDNLNLYEKTRYVSTYARGGTHSSTSASAYTAAPPAGSFGASSIHASDNTSSGLSVDRYRHAYEANLSPFAAFRGREHTRAFKRMSLPERIIFSFTRIVLANRTSRNLFAFYCVALHLLVFAMLFGMHSTDSIRHANALGNMTGNRASNSGPGAGLSNSGKIGGSQDISGHDWQEEDFR